LLASIGDALGAPPFSRNGQSYMWVGEHYSATASFLSREKTVLFVTIRPKKTSAPPLVDKPASPPAVAEQQKTVIDLDAFIDWKNPLDLTKVAFQSIMRQHQINPGERPYAEYRDVHPNGDITNYFVIKPSLTPAYSIEMTMLGKRFKPTSFRVIWNEGRAKSVRVILERPLGQTTPPKEIVEALDALLGFKAEKRSEALYIWTNERFTASYTCYVGDEPLRLDFEPPQAPVVATVVPPASPPPATTIPGGSLDNQGFVLDLDPLVNWQDPFSLAKEKLDGLFQSALAKKGGPLWIHTASGEATVFGTGNGNDGLPQALFSGRLKVISASATWQEPRMINFVVATGTPADEEWLYAKLDNVLEVTRRRMNFADSAVVAHEWMPKNYRVVATRLSNASIRLTIARATGGFNPVNAPGPLAANLDALLNFSSFWTWTASDFEKTYTPKAAKNEDQKKPQQFEWLSSAKDRARFSRHMESEVETKLTMFGGSVKLEEAVLEFVNGKAARATISFFNRGDSGDIEVKEFDRMFKLVGQNLTQVMKVAPKRQILSGNAALQVSGWMWSSPGGIALLEYTEYDTPGKVTKPEFLRLKLASPNQADWSMGKLATGIQRMELLKRVTKTPEGDVYLSGVPMVDQGAKGYCVAASCQRLFEYMRIPCDQHEMAKLVGVQAEGGADVAIMQKSLAKIDGAFKVTFKPLVNPEMYYATNGKRRVSEKEFISLVKEYVDKGVPLLWGLALGEKPEDPPLQGAGQVRGGHMRMVIGYNLAKNKILFTDSWGAGHELKRMAMLDAYDVTLGLFSMAPRGL